MFRTAYRITGNTADAEDLLQTIFLRLVRRESPQAAVGNEESYFRRAAVNASIDLIRTRHTDGSVPFSDVADFHLPSSGGDGNQREQRDCLRRAFARLSPRLAEVFALRHFEDFTNQQIAATLGMSPILVAVTLHRAKRQLQQYIRFYSGGSI